MPRSSLTSSSLPGAAREWGVMEFPVSLDLRRILQHMGVQRLADLKLATLNRFHLCADASFEMSVELAKLFDMAQGMELMPRSQALPQAGAATQALLPAPARQAVGPGTEDILLIPEQVRQQPVLAFGLSVRLAHVMEFIGAKVMGDLHGLRLADLSHYRNCGAVTLAELRSLVAGLQRRWPSAETKSATNQPCGAGNDVFNISPGMHHLSARTLPGSLRLHAALERNGIERLGQLHGMAIADFQRRGQCGPRVVKSLQRLLWEATPKSISSREFLDASADI